MYNDYLSRKLLILAKLLILVSLATEFTLKLPKHWLPQTISYQISFTLKQCMPKTVSHAETVHA